MPKPTLNLRFIGDLVDAVKDKMSNLQLPSSDRTVSVGSRPDSTGQPVVNSSADMGSSSRRDVSPDEGSSGWSWMYDNAFTDWVDKVGPEKAFFISTLAMLGIGYAPEIASALGMSKGAADAWKVGTENSQGKLSSAFGSLGSLFSGSNGSGLLDSLLGVGSQYASSVLNMKNMEHLIDKQNAYNTPAEQMARFKDAGLNENLIYGLGSNGNQPASGSIAPVDFDTSQRENRMARMTIDTTRAISDATLKEKQSAIAVNNALAGKTNAERIAQENTNTLFEVQRNLIQSQLDEQVEKARIAKTEADNKQEWIDADIALKNAEKAAAEFRSHTGAYNAANEFTGGLSSQFFDFLQRFVEKYWGSPSVPKRTNN